MNVQVQIVISAGYIISQRNHYKAGLESTNKSVSHKFPWQNRRQAQTMIPAGFTVRV
jgi:hypothetical protein